MTIFSKLFGHKSTTDEHFRLLKADDFREAIQKPNVQLIDVRTASEYQGGHIAGAQNLDYFQKEAFYKGLERLNKTQPVYLYCRSGNRSRKAAAHLIDRGFTEVIDLKGGILQWKP